MKLNSDYDTIYADDHGLAAFEQVDERLFFDESGQPSTDTETQLIEASPEELLESYRNSQAFEPKREFTWIERTTKRSFDIGVASIALLACLPIFAVIAVLLMFENGPLIYKQRRIGKGGVPFDCYKFRTMKVDADNELARVLYDDPRLRAEWAATQKLTNDPRITEVGKILRKTSLDELPQLINILKGEMSLVGPRPILAKELERYGGFVDYYLTATPGLTGLWQVSGRNLTTYRRRVALDVNYVRKASFALDLAIVLRTAKALFNQEGAL